jgi:integrase/recombinase XerD
LTAPTSDLDDGALHVRAAKQSKQREVPLHESTTKALREYGRLRDRYLPEPATPAFFVSVSGARLAKGTFNHTFARLIRQTGLEGRGERARPRPHNLRHTFAVRTLLDWYRAGVDVDAQLPLLSTFLGHVDPVSTYWYLQASPELFAVACERLERAGEDPS